MIGKIKLKNYKNFRETDIICNSKRNIFVGENGVGKSTILQAISMVLTGSVWQLDKMGIGSLFNVSVVEEYEKISREKRSVKKLPILYIELYFSEDIDPKDLSKTPYKLKGGHNSIKSYKYGIRFKAEPDIENFSSEIEETIKNSDAFPFDYYKATFETFDGTSYTSYNKPFQVRPSFIDTTSINTTTALKNQVSRIFESQADKKKRQKISHAYHEIANNFSLDLYGKHELDNNSEYMLKLKASTEANFREILTAQNRDRINIESLGNGEKVLLGVDSSLTKANDKYQIMLIEEPENHLSSNNMHKLIRMIETAEEKQTFIATHSNTIASRLNLSNVILMGDFPKPLKLSDVDSETEKFFAKAPNSNILDFILAKKVILVEGSAEYILMNAFYEQITGHEPYEDGVSVISGGGKTFERYLKVAQPLKKTVAVITDNDGDISRNITEKYKNYVDKNIRICSDDNKENNTFEICVFNENQNFFDIHKITKSDGVLDYMLNNKAEAAFRLLNLLQDENVAKDFTIPKYIKDTIEWITTN